METNLLSKSPFRDELYIPRAWEEAQCLRALERRGGGSVVTVIGPTGYGKTWLLQRLSSRLKAKYPNGVFVWIDLYSLCAQAKTIDELFLSLCRQLTQPFPNSEKILADGYLKRGTAVRRFVNLLRNILDQHVASEFVLILDPGDGAVGQPYQGDFYNALRACLEQSDSQTQDASVRYWWKLKMLLTTSYPNTFLSTVLYASPFNIGTGVELSRFSREQTLMMAQNFGVNIGGSELSNLERILGGHPTLIHQCLRLVSHEHIALRSVLDDTKLQREIFESYLNRNRKQLMDSPALVQALRDVSKNPKVGLSLPTLASLYRLGLIEVTSEGSRICRELDLALLS